LAIFVLKIIKLGETLTKLWQKQFWLFFFIETRCIWDQTGLPAPDTGERVPP